jgi:hypothetical protein
MSSNGIIKQIHIAGKGHNETLEIAITLKNTRAAHNVIQDHVPENGGT